MYRKNKWYSLYKFYAIFFLLLNKIFFIEHEIKNTYSIVHALERFHIPSFNYLMSSYGMVLNIIQFSSHLLLNWNDEEKYGWWIIVWTSTQIEKKIKTTIRNIKFQEIFWFPFDLNYHIAILNETLIFFSL